MLLHLRRQPPHNPYTVNSEGRGPAWCNSLFEDNAEFSLGFRLSIDMHVQRGPHPARAPGAQGWRAIGYGTPPSDQYSEARASSRSGSEVVALRKVLAGIDTADARQLHGALADYLVRKSVWPSG